MSRLKQKFNPKKIITLLVIFCLFFGVGFTVICRLYFETYRAFTDIELVATVECKRADATGETFLDVQFCRDEILAEKKTYPFKADEWVFEGRIIKWKNLVNLLGAKTYYQLERISGRYFDIEKEKNMPRIVYDLTERKDKFWFFIYRYQKLIPFIDAAYGNSAFVLFKPGKSFKVYITNTGFMIKDVSVPQERSWWPVG